MKLTKAESIALRKAIEARMNKIQNLIAYSLIVFVDTGELAEEYKSLEGILNKITKG